MRQIAEDVLQASRPSAANLAYGKLAKRLVEALDWQPDERADGSPVWMSVIAEGWYPPTRASLKSEYELVMIPALASVIRSGT